MSEVELLGHRFSAFSFRVEVALKLKNIKYDFTGEDLPNKSPALLKYNPVYKKVPVLVHNGKPLAESLIIFEYIDDTWDGTPLLPKDPYHRAQARFWANFVDEKCFPMVRKLAYGNFEDREKARDEAKELLKHLEDELNSEKTLLGGQNIWIIDITACVLGYWLGVIQEAAGVVVFSRETHPKFYEWIDRIFEYNVIKETLPPKDKLLAFYRAHIAEGGSSVIVNQS